MHSALGCSHVLTFQHINNLIIPDDLFMQTVSQIHNLGMIHVTPKLIPSRMNSVQVTLPHLFILHLQPIKPILQQTQLTLQIHILILQVNLPRPILTLNLPQFLKPKHLLH
jgi:hypothetical protein